MNKRPEYKILKHLLPEDMTGCHVVDVGCGYGYTGLWLHSLRRGGVYTGVEINPDIVNVVQQLGIYDTVLCRDVVASPLDGFFNVAIAQHVIEHQTLAKGFDLMRLLERVAKRVIIVTPYGFTESEATEENPYSKHLSGWYPQFFRARGYTVQLVRNPHSSRVVDWFTHAWYRLRGNRYGGYTIVAWKDLS